jgi:hypothetical protein
VTATKPPPQISARKQTPADWRDLPRRLRERGDYFLSRQKRGDAELMYDAATEIEVLRERLK